MNGTDVNIFAQCQSGIFLVVLIGLGFLVFFSFIRAVKGPRVADRLVAVNMIGTMVMVMIAVLSLVLEEEYLLDICLIYAMMSFLAVIVISKVYIGIYEEQHLNENDRNEGLKFAVGGNDKATAADTEHKEDGADERLGMD